MKTLHQLQTIAFADMAAIVLAVGTDVVEGWSKLTAIGILGALLAVILYFWPKYQAAEREATHKQYQSTLTTQADAHAKAMGAMGETFKTECKQMSTDIKSQTDEIKAQRQQNHDFQQRQIALLTEAVKHKEAK